MELPAYCAACDKVYYFRGISISGGILNFSGNVYVCPAGHNASIIDGTFEILDSLPRLLKDGNNTRDILAKIHRLADAAKAGSTTPEEALEEALALLPKELSAVIKKSSVRHPLATLMLILFILNQCTGVAGNLKGFLPSNPPPNVVINNNISLIPSHATDHIGGGAVPQIKREQARRLAHKARQEQKHHQAYQKPPIGGSAPK